ncbi:hypothetical protein FRC00_000894 [Tulasnella sp. 408]|nr:hypothetical protein FRC00_000894 [Tulasnella sp. 408]
MTRKEPINRTHLSKRELFAAEANDGTLLVFKQASSKPYSQWTESEKKAANSEKLKWEQLTHPNVLPFLGTSLYEDTFFLVSKFAEYGDIIHYLEIEKEGPTLRLVGSSPGPIFPQQTELTPD